MPIQPKRDFFVALMLLTRLPLPFRVPDTYFAKAARAVWAYPLVGLVVAALSVGVAMLALWAGISVSVAAGLLVATQVITCGALHEDGLADFTDGIWGGHTPERRMEIMRDSRIGTYGVLALVLCIGIRWQALAGLEAEIVLPAFTAVAMLSRAAMPCVMAGLPYARADGLARSVGRPGVFEVGIGLLLAIGAVFLLLGLYFTIALLLVSVLVASLVAGIALRRLGGYTGDVLGACQLLTETASLVLLTAIL